MIIICKQRSLHSVLIGFSSWPNIIEFQIEMTDGWQRQDFIGVDLVSLLNVFSTISMIPISFVEGAHKPCLQWRHCGKFQQKFWQKEIWFLLATGFFSCDKQPFYKSGCKLNRQHRPTSSCLMPLPHEFSTSPSIPFFTWYSTTFANFKEINLFLPHFYQGKIQAFSQKSWNILYRSYHGRSCNVITNCLWTTGAVGELHLAVFQLIPHCSYFPSMHAFSLISLAMTTKSSALRNGSFGKE